MYIITVFSLQYPVQLNNYVMNKETDIGFDKSILPPWVKFIAKDQDGEWNFFIAKPLKKRDFWSAVHRMPICPKHQPTRFYGTWEESLFHLDELPETNFSRF